MSRYHKILESLKAITCPICAGCGHVAKSGGLFSPQTLVPLHPGEGNRSSLTECYKCKGSGKNK